MLPTIFQLSVRCHLHIGPFKSRCSAYELTLLAFTITRFSFRTIGTGDGTSSGHVYGVHLCPSSQELTFFAHNKRDERGEEVNSNATSLVLTIPTNAAGKNGKKAPLRGNLNLCLPVHIRYKYKKWENRHKIGDWCLTH